jgi:hypothetical protein
MRNALGAGKWEPWNSFSRKGSMSGRTQSAGLIPGATSDGIRTRNSVLIEVLFTPNGSVWRGAAQQTVRCDRFL